MAKEEPQPEIPVQVGGEEAPSSFELVFEQHKNSILFGLVVIVLAVFAYVIFEHRKNSANEAAAHAFTSAKTIAEFDAVNQQHRGTIAAGNALLMKADLQARDEKLNEAQATLIEFTTNHTDHPRYLQGVLSLGILAQQKGDLDEAERYFQQVIDTEETPDVAPLALIRKGDIAYARGDYPAARTLYQSVEPTYPGSPFALAARQKLNREKLKPPKPTSAPKPAPAPNPETATKPAGASPPADPPKSPNPTANPDPDPTSTPISPQPKPEQQANPATPQEKAGDAPSSP